MNRIELARRVSQHFGFTQREANLIVDHWLKAIIRELAQGRRVELRGLGTFGVRARKASVGRVVKTGKTVAIPPLKRVFFRPGRELKEISFPVKTTA